MSRTGKVLYTLCSVVLLFADEALSQSIIAGAATDVLSTPTCSDGIPNWGSAVNGNFFDMAYAGHCKRFEKQFVYRIDDSDIKPI